MTGHSVRTTFGGASLAVIALALAGVTAGQAQAQRGVHGRAQPIPHPQLTHLAAGAALHLRAPLGVLDRLGLGLEIGEQPIVDAWWPLMDATKLLLDTKEGITKLRGKEFEFSRAGNDAVLLPTFHPSAVLRSGGKALAEARADFVRVKRVLARVA